MRRHPAAADDLERGVETLAGALGADVIRAVAPSPASMARIATQTSSYYLAAFEPDSNDRADAPASYRTPLAPSPT